MRTSSTPTLSEIAKIQRSAEAGNAKAQLDLARRLDKGLGIKEDQQTAFQWYLKAANSGVSDAMVEVAKRYCDGRGSMIDDQASIQWFSRAANAGNAESQYQEAMKKSWVESLSFQTFTFGKDSNEARENSLDLMRWLDTAAGQNYLPAINDLGIVYLAGIEYADFDSRRFVRGKELVSEDCDARRHKSFLFSVYSVVSDPTLNSRYLLDAKRKLLNQPNVEKGISMLTKAGNLGYWKSQLALAAIYQFGFGKIKSDADMAKKWWDKLAEQTESAAEVGIGELYYCTKTELCKTRNWRGRNLSMKESNQVARDWFERAAAANNGDASYHLAHMYLDGTIEVNNNEKAVKLLEKALRNGTNYLSARYELAEALYDGKGVAKDYPRALELFKDRAIQDPSVSYDAAMSRFYVAKFYELGLGVNPDPVLAYAWCNIAATAFSNELINRNKKQWDQWNPAREHLGVLEMKLKPEEIAEAQSITRDWQPGAELARQRVNASSASSTSARNLTQVGSATGIGLSENGYILTNNHVVNNCTELKIVPEASAAKVVVVDVSNDLAVIKMDAKIKTHALIATSDELSQGDEIVVFGYPLSGYLSSSGNIATGIISALTGPGNNASLIQISAPVQAGNSGGPVLDKMGRVVGVVVGKADSIKIAKAIGDIPQNVNFAITGRTVKSFLDANRIEYEKSSSWFRSSRTSSELANEAREFTFRIECWR